MPFSFFLPHPASVHFPHLRDFTHNSSSNHPPNCNDLQQIAPFHSCLRETGRLVLVVLTPTQVPAGGADRRLRNRGSSLTV
jgi:hypothetical protein